MKEGQYGATLANKAQPSERNVRFPIILAVLGAGLVFTGLAAVVRWASSSGAEAPPGQSMSIASNPAPEAAEETVTKAAPVPPPVAVPAPASSPRLPSATAPTPSADPRGLVQELRSLDLSAGPVTPARATQWKKSLAQLVQAGAASVPTIAELLAANQNQYYSLQDGALLGYGSLRAALFDALEQIGGAAARDILVGTLRQAGDAAEIRLLATHLEQLAPGQYRQDILAAARETLDLASKGQLPGGDMGPVFEVLRQYGDSSVIADLQASRRQWSHYAAIALAGLPNGEGIPSLLETAQTESRQKPADYLMSFQLLAQASARQNAAASGLLDLARENKIPAAAWPQIAQGLLAAEAYQYGQPTSRNLSGYATASVNGGQQQFYTPPLLAERDGELIQARLGFIDQVLAVTADPTATALLVQTRGRLAGAPRR